MVPTQIGVQIGVRVCPVPTQGDGIMEALDGVEMTETVIEIGLEATIEQIIPIQLCLKTTISLNIQAISVIAAGIRSGPFHPEVAPRP